DAVGSRSSQEGGQRVRRSLQQRAPAQRHRVRGAQGQAGGPGRGDLEGARRKIGGRSGAPPPEASTSDVAGRAKSGLQLNMIRRKDNLSARRIGLCWEATRAPRRTRIPQAWAISVA